METKIKVGDTVRDRKNGKEYFVNAVSYDGRLMHITQTTISDAPTLPLSGWAPTLLYNLVEGRNKDLKKDLTDLIAAFNYAVQKDRHINPTVDRENMGVLIHENWRNKITPKLFGNIELLFSKDIEDEGSILIIHNVKPIKIK